jgi:cytochrome bd-I ubiquinol oxidase subunit X
VKTNKLEENDMWYFAWLLGVGFAVMLAIVNAMWGENEEARLRSHRRDEEA